MNLGDRLRDLGRYYRGARGVWRELLAAIICLALGIVLMPCLIFLAGRIALGPYARGSLFALWHDYLQGLISGSMAAWFIAFGPYVLLWLLRGGRRLLHNRGTAARRQ